MPIIDYNPLPEPAGLQGIDGKSSGSSGPAEAATSLPIFNVTTLKAMLKAIGITVRPGLIESNAFELNVQGWQLTAEGLIKAFAGIIGGWTIEAGALFSGGATQAVATILIDAANGIIRIGTTAGKYITLDGPNQRIQSSNYVSGVMGSGFSLSPELLEVGNIAARGMIRTAVFQKDVVSAVGGNLVVLDADVLAVDMTALDASTLTIEGNTTFSVGDFLRIKDGLDDEWFEVTDASSAPEYVVTRDKAGTYAVDTNPTWTKGASVVNYRASGEGGIYMTASESNAPYVSVFTHAGAPWTAITTHVRMGNLNGFLGYISDLYGIAIGDATNYLKYDPTNGLRIAGSISVAPGSTLPTLPGDESLAAFWSFDEGAGSNAIDATSNANNGTITSGTYVAGVSGTALECNSSTTSVNAGSGASIDDIFNGGGSLSVWLNIDSDGQNNNGHILRKGTNGVNRGWYLSTENEVGGAVNLVFRRYWSGGTALWYTATKVSINEWHHIVLTYDDDSTANDPILYVDGVAVTFTEFVAPSGARTTDASDDFYISNKSGGSATFDGTIDEVRLYNDVLTAMEVYALYQNPSGVTQQGVKQVGGVYDSAVSGARVRIFPNSNTGIQIIDNAGADVFKALVGGTDVGDVIIGSESGGKYIKWDKSAANFIVKADKSNLMLYDATVDAGGDGDYTTIQAAVAAGETDIFIRNGAYTLSSDTTLVDGTSLIGESKRGVVITFNSTSRTMIAGTTPSTYDTGTVTISTDSKTVTGSSTAWIANASAGEFILLNEAWYEIASVGGDTTITLVEFYVGPNLSGASYDLNSFAKDFYISNLTMVGARLSGATFLDMRGCMDSIIDNVAFFTNTTVRTGIGVKVTCGSNVKITNCEFSGLDRGVWNASTGTFTIDSSNTEISSCEFLSCAYSVDEEAGVQFSKIVKNNFLNSYNYCQLNGSKGVFSNNRLISRAAGIICEGGGSWSIVNNRFSNPASFVSSGVAIRVDSAYNTILGNIINCCYVAIQVLTDVNTIANNIISTITDDGIILSANFCTISGNVISYAGAVGIDGSSSAGNNVINGNSIIASASEGILLGSSASRNSIIGNNITNGSSDGIDNSGDDNTISGNTIYGNGGWGVDIQASADQTLVQGNNLDNNTSGAINDGGTNTIESPAADLHNQE